MSVLIPVIDLLRGQVVHAIAGRRDEYRPIRSQLCNSANPGDVARAMRQQFHSTQCYVADLDSLTCAADQPVCCDLTSLGEIDRGGLRPWLDVGLGSLEHFEQLRDQLTSASLHPKFIVALESLQDPESLVKLVTAIGENELIFSLDLRDGAPRSPSFTWQNLTPLKIAERVIAAGVNRLIVLDIAAVGVGGGPVTLPLCREIRRRSPQIELVSGGGVRTVADICALIDAGCDGVLVASALHDGRITPADLGLGKELQSGL